MSNGQIVAVYADDTEHDYHLLKVQTGNCPYIGNRDHRFCGGGGAHCQQADRAYICSELDPKPNIVLKEDVHLNIFHEINALIML